MIYDLQKASTWKRISAFLFDAIIMSVVVLGVAFLLSSVLGYDGYVARLGDSYAKYEEEYGVKFNISQDEYNALSKSEQENYEAAVKAISGDGEVVYVFSMLLNFTLIIITFSLLSGFILLELVIPLLLKNGQTLGKKVFGIGIMRVDGVKVTPTLMFVRTVLGKYTIGTMVPVLLIIMIYFGFLGIVGTIVIGLILLLQIILMIATRTNSPIHDLLANTVAVDLASQMIFDSAEELMEYKKRIHAESVSTAEYK